MAEPPVSPVRIRMHSSSWVTKIFPSPISPFSVRAAPRIASTVTCLNSSLQAMSNRIFGARAGATSSPSVDGLMLGLATPSAAGHGDSSDFRTDQSLADFIEFFRANNGGD